MATVLQQKISKPDREPDPDPDESGFWEQQAGRREQA